MTEAEIMKEFKELLKAGENSLGIKFQYGFSREFVEGVVALLNLKNAEIERLQREATNVRRKALLEASRKFSGHSDYHGDTILCYLICMAEGKEVGNARPLDTCKMKEEARAEAIKEFAERVKEESILTDKFGEVILAADIDQIAKEMGVEK